MIEVILLVCFKSCLDATAEEAISACKNAEKYAILTLIFEKFSGGIAPDPILRRGYGAPLQTPNRGHLDYQVLRAPQYLNPALRLLVTLVVISPKIKVRFS